MRSQFNQTERIGLILQVINLRSIRPFDRATIVASVAKTHRAVTVEEGWPTCGIGSEVHLEIA